MGKNVNAHTRQVGCDEIREKRTWYGARYGILGVCTFGQDEGEGRQELWCASFSEVELARPSRMEAELTAIQNQGRQHRIYFWLNESRQEIRSILVWFVAQDSPHDPAPPLPRRGR